MGRLVFSYIHFVGQYISHIIFQNSLWWYECVLTHTDSVTGEGLSFQLLPALELYSQHIFWHFMERHRHRKNLRGYFNSGKSPKLQNQQNNVVFKYIFYFKSFFITTYSSTLQKKLLVFNINISISLSLRVRLFLLGR